MYIVVMCFKGVNVVFFIYSGVFFNCDKIKVVDDGFWVNI